MASNQILENEDPRGREEPVIEILNPEQLAQENQALKNKMEVMEAQMAKIMNMMQHLRSGAAAGAAAVVNPEGVVTFVPPPVSAEIITVHPVSRPEVSHSAQIYPWGMPRNFTPSIADAIPTVTSQPAVVTSTGATGVPHVHIPSPNIAPPRSSPALAPEMAMNPPSAAYPVGNPAQYGGYYFSPGSYPQGQIVEGSQSKYKYHLLEERLRAMEGSGTRAKDARDLCLVPGVVIPPKFKAPDFDKYRGTECPSSHLTMYVRKMAAYAHDDKVLIHFFQNSLTGASLDWYMQLQSSDIHSWKDLSEAFLKHYQYNIDLAPDRSQLQHMSKGDKESFKEYAQRWRSIAAQVKPSLTEKEMVHVFMETLPAFYYDRLIGSVSTNFSDMATVGERIEVGIKRGRISCNLAGTNNASDFPVKKNGETNAIMGQRRSSKFSPIPMLYTDLCGHLVNHNLISLREMKPVQPPFPRGYDSDARCDFHSGAIGHSTESCKPFKYLVQELIDTKKLAFNEDGGILTASLNP